MRLAILGAAFLCASNICLAADSSETLIVPPYPGQTPWTQTKHEQKELTETKEWRPSDQVGGAFRDQLSLTKIRNDSKRSSSQSIMIPFGILKITCLGGVRINGPIERIENGATVSYSQAYCSNQYSTSEDLDIFTKTLRGQDHLYTVTRIFRRPTENNPVPGVRRFPGDQADAAKAAMEEQLAANQYLGQIRLCPSAEPCPIPTAWPIDGKTPQSEVRERLGKPTMENQSPDGRHIDFYEGPDGLFRAYLYGKDNVLIRPSVHTAPKQ
jgi:hypothetical protein